MDPTDYVTRLILNLRGILNDPQKCAEVMVHDKRHDEVGILDLFDTWESEQWEKDNPEEAEQLWEGVDLEELSKNIAKRREELREEEDK